MEDGRRGRRRKATPPQGRPGLPSRRKADPLRSHAPSFPTHVYAPTLPPKHTPAAWTPTGAVSRCRRRRTPPCGGPAGGQSRTPGCQEVGLRGAGFSVVCRRSRVVPRAARRAGRCLRGLDALRCAILGVLRCPWMHFDAAPCDARFARFAGGCWLCSRDPMVSPFACPQVHAGASQTARFSILGAAATPPPPARSLSAANSNASRLQRRLGGPQLPLGRPRTKPRLLKGPTDQLSPAALAQG